MNYISVAQAAEKWQVTPKRVQVLCSEGRIEGAQRVGNQWTIPETAEKPQDARKKLLFDNPQRINNSISILTKNLSNLVESGGQVVSTYVSRISQPLFFHGWQMEHIYFVEMSKAGFAQPYNFALPDSKLSVYDYQII